jgi:hypothetical protein
VAGRPASPRPHRVTAATAPARGVPAEERASSAGAPVAAAEPHVDDPRIAADAPRIAADALRIAADAPRIAADAPLLGPVPRSRPPARAAPGGERRERRDRSPPAAASGDTAEPRPVVRVTIGRIDVRGAPASAPPARPGPVRHQPLGLDEYLRRRDQPPGGSR